MRFDLSVAEEQDPSEGADGRIAMVPLADWELAANRVRVLVGWRTDFVRVSTHRCRAPRRGAAPVARDRPRNFSRLTLRPSADPRPDAEFAARE